MNRFGDPTRWMLGGLIVFVGILYWFLPRPGIADPNPRTGQPRTVITVVGGHLERDRQMWDALERGFEADHPHLDLKVLRGGGIRRKVDTMIAGGVAPDVISIDADLARPYMQAGVLRDLTPYIERDPQLSRDIHRGRDSERGEQPPDFFRFATEAFVRDGKQYALPIWYMNFFVYYNKALFDKYNVPYPDEDWDWQGFRERCIALTRDSQGRPMRIPLRDDAGNIVTDDRGWTVYVANPAADPIATDFGMQAATWQHGVECFVRQNGGHFFENVGTPAETVDVDNPKTREALWFLYEILMVQGCRPSNFISAGLTDNVSFRDGHIGMIAPYAIFGLIDMRDNVRDFEWDVAPLPKGPDGRRASIVFPTGFAVSSQSQHPDEAFAFVKWFASPRGASILARWPLFIPARRSIALSPEHFLDPATKPDSDWAMVHDVSFPYVDPATGAEQIGYAILPQAASARHEDVFLAITERFGELLRYGTYTTDAFDEFVADHGRPPTVAEAREVHRVAFRMAMEEIEDRAGLMYAWAQSQVQSGENRSPMALWTPMLVALTAGLVLFAFWRWRSPATIMGPLERRQQYWGYLLISPWIVGFVCLTAGPILFSIGLSMCKWQSLTSLADAEFIGLENYARALGGEDPRFFKSLNATLQYTIFAVPLSVIGGLTLALLLNTKLRGINYWRTFYFVPSVLPIVAVSVLYYYLFNPTQGWINHTLRAIGWADPPDWLTSDEPVLGIPAPMWMFIMMHLWTVGGAMIIYLGSLQGIPTQLYEAAEVDGAGKLRQLRHVTLPMISPVLFFMIIMGIIGSFQVFTSAYVLFESGGGPRESTLFYVLHLFNEAVNRYRFGYGAALAWILFAIILILTAAIFKSSPMWVYYEGQREQRVGRRKAAKGGA